tara:strand:- start:5324 stop:6016 length:693 start_codon:yes stop_codon:yes gene_type:complete
MSNNEIQKKVLELSREEEWNHLYTFPNGVRTRTFDINSPGYNINKWSRLEPILDKVGVKDKTVLDVGCSDGYFSIGCAKKGATLVKGIDPDPLRIKRAIFAKSVYELQNVDFEVMDLYDLNNYENFDIVIGLGLLHRIPDINACLEKMAQNGNILILEFKTLNNEKAICRWGGGETKSNKHNKLYYIPTQNYVKQEMEKLGFLHNHFTNDKQSGLNYKRTILVSSKEKIY